ncbi:uncharacterized protein LOC119287372 [Triticum dicoccoides]|uniref:uncharacterized protein LOC119287372 n=1 Tax=Triticum dicoccoides TaxID=85692 RepID=UPI00188E3017|nr:uncharacterized protein LOC119287372 [Triticum dicoccoides]
MGRVGPKKVGAPDLICLIAAWCTLVSSVGNFHEYMLGDTNSCPTCELVTGTMEVVICGPYIVLKWQEFLPNKLPRPLKSLITWRPNVWIFRDTAILVIISYLILLDINLSFLWLFIFPVIAIVFIRAVRFKFSLPTCSSNHKVTHGSSNGAEETKMKTKKVGIIVIMTLGALLGMDQLPDHAADGFAISQFLIFLSSMVAALTRMMMKLRARASSLGIATASEMLHKTLLILLLVTAHTGAAEWLGEDVVLLCLPEVIPVLGWFILHIDRKPDSSSIISLDKMKARINWLGLIGAMVGVFAYLLFTMDESGLFGWCMTFQVSCGVSGILTCYLVFMLNHWTRQQVAPASKEDGASGMLKLWACALLIAWAASLLLGYLVSRRLGLQLPLHATAMYVGNLFGFKYSH